MLLTKVVCKHTKKSDLGPKCVMNESEPNMSRFFLFCFVFDKALTLSIINALVYTSGSSPLGNFLTSRLNSGLTLYSTVQYTHLYHSTYLVKFNVYMPSNVYEFSEG